MRLFLLALFAFAGLSYSQSNQPIPITSHTVIGVLSTLPVTCSVGDTFALTAPTPGLFSCVSINTFAFIPSVQTGSAFPNTCTNGQDFIRVDLTSTPNFYVCSGNQFLAPTVGTTLLVPTAGAWPLPIAANTTLSAMIVADIGTAEAAATALAATNTSNQISALNLNTAATMPASAFDSAGTAASAAASAISSSVASSESFTTAAINSLSLGSAAHSPASSFESSGTAASLVAGLSTVYDPINSASTAQANAIAASTANTASQISALHLGSAATEPNSFFDLANSASAAQAAAISASTANTTSQLNALSLGSASKNNSGDFEAAGSAAAQIAALNLSTHYDAINSSATALGTAETFATTAANTAQSNAIAASGTATASAITALNLGSSSHSASTAYDPAGAATTAANNAQAAAITAAEAASDPLGSSATSTTNSEAFTTAAITSLALGSASKQSSSAFDGSGVGAAQAAASLSTGETFTTNAIASLSLQSASQKPASYFETSGTASGLISSLNLSTSYAPIVSGVVPAANLPPLLQLGTTSTTALAGNTAFAPLVSGIVPTGNLPPLLALGTTSTTALAGNTPYAPLVAGTVPTANLPPLLALGTTSSTALAGNTALLGLGTTSTTALAGNTSLLQLGTTSTTALAGNSISNLNLAANYAPLVGGLVPTANLPPLLSIGTTSSTALAGSTPLLQLGTTSSTALAGNTAYAPLVAGLVPTANLPPLLQLGTTSTTALAGNTPLLQLGTTSTTAMPGNTALLSLGTTSTTALAGNAITNLNLSANYAPLVSGVVPLANLPSGIGLALGTTSTTALAGNTPLLQLGTTSTTALAGNTPYAPLVSGLVPTANLPPLLQLGTTSSTALAGNTPYVSSINGSSGAVTVSTLTAPSSGIVKSNGTVLQTASPGTDYLTPSTGVTTVNGSSGAVTVSTLSAPSAGIVKTNGTVLQTATAGTDYLTPATGVTSVNGSTGAVTVGSTTAPASGMVKSNGTVLQTAVAGTDYVIPSALTSISNYSIGTKLRAAAIRADASNATINPPLITPSAWAASTSYFLGQIVSNGGNLYEVVAPSTGTATSGSSGGPTGTGAVIAADGGVTWMYYANPVPTGINQNVLVTYPSSSCSSGLSQSISAFNSGSTAMNPLFTMHGATPYPWGTFAISASTTTVASSGNTAGQSGTATQQNNGVQYVFETDAPKICISAAANGGTANNLRFLVNDNYLTLGAARPYYSGGNAYTLIDFGTSADGRKPRKITMESQNSVYFNGIYVDALSTVWPEGQFEIPIKAAFIGNSILAGGGYNTAIAGDNIPFSVGKKLGWSDSWNMAEGGTDYQFYSSGVTYNYIGHIPTDLARATFDVVCFCLGGINDTATSGYNATNEQAAALAAFQAARTAAPNAVIIVTGPYPGTNPGIVALENAIYAGWQQFSATGSGSDTNTFFIPVSVGSNAGSAVAATQSPWVSGAGYVGSPTGSGNADIYVGQDQVHQTPIGTKYLSERLAQAIRQLMPLIK